MEIKDTFTYRDVLIMRDNLDQVNQIDGTDPKFLYAVSRNKSRLDSIIKHLNNIKKPSDEMTAFWKDLDEINKNYAEVDDTGTVLYVNVQFDGRAQKGYKKVIGEGNPDSPYTKEVNELKAKNQDEIDKYEASVKQYNTMLDEEVPEEDYRKFMIDFSIVPKGLHPRAMDGCLVFVREVPQEEKVEKKT